MVLIIKSGGNSSQSDAETKHGNDPEANVDNNTSRKILHSQGPVPNNPEMLHLVHELVEIRDMVSIFMKITHEMRESSFNW